MSEQVWYLSIAELAARYRQRELLPSEVTALVLQRIQAINPSLNAFILVLEEQAMLEARAAEAAFRAGWDLGPLQGVPIGIKDLIDLQGYPTTAGSTFLGTAPAAASATLVKRLRGHGAVILGKQHLHEFAADGPLNRRWGRCENPWMPGRYTGGSSSGSGAAVSAGLGFAAIGSDTAGSIRFPASYCGTVGFKPTYGRVPVTGTVPLSWSLDHFGPLTRTVEDAAIVLGAIAGHDQADRRSASEPVADYREKLRTGVAGLRVGVPRNHFFEHLHPETEAAVLRSAALLTDQGAEVVDVTFPDAASSIDVLMSILWPETAAVHRDWFDAHPDDYGPLIRTRIETGRSTPVVDYILAKQEQSRIRDAVDRLLQTVDVILTAVTPSPAPPVDDIVNEPRPLRLRLSGPFNVTGLPALAVPAAMSREGLPIGVQIGGRAFDEATVLRVGFALEKSAGVAQLHPPL